MVTGVSPWSWARRAPSLEPPAPQKRSVTVSSEVASSMGFLLGQWGRYAPGGGAGHLPRATICRQIPRARSGGRGQGIAFLTRLWLSGAGRRRPRRLERRRQVTREVLGNGRLRLLNDLDAGYVQGRGHALEGLHVQHQDLGEVLAGVGGQGLPVVDQAGLHPDTRRRVRAFRPRLRIGGERCAA